MPLPGLGSGVEHPLSLARQSLGLYNINLTTTVPAPETGAGTAANGENLIGLDNDFDAFVRHNRPPLNLYPVRVSC